MILDKITGYLKRIVYELRTDRQLDAILVYRPNTLEPYGRAYHVPYESGIC